MTDDEKKKKGRYWCLDQIIESKKGLLCRHPQLVIPVRNCLFPSFSAFGIKIPWSANPEPVRLGKVWGIDFSREGHVTLVRTAGFSNRLQVFF